ncbi:MAG: hypothetical protein RLZZ488_854 [Pseudomonadota bacterium]|jgi:hypothetical protein
MKHLSHKLSLLKDTIFCVSVKLLKISSCLELWSKDSPQSIGTLPLTLSGGWQFASCGSYIRIDSPDGQIITLVSDEFTIDGARYRIKRRVQINRKAHALFFKTNLFRSHKRTAPGLVFAALIAATFSFIFLKQSWRSEINLSADARNEEKLDQNKNEIFRAQANPTSSASQFSGSAAPSPESSENNLKAGDVPPEKFPRAKAVKRRMNEKDAQRKEKIDPVHCTPIKHISQSKILERLQGTAHNRRGWYVCR